MLLLASASPRRRELLGSVGVEFRVVPAEVEECEDHSLPAPALALLNARRKCLWVLESSPGYLVLAADTVVTLGDRHFGKPSDLEEASAMLRELAGRSHDVVTGVCLTVPGAASIEFAETSTVRFRKWDEVDADAYFRRVNPLDKAGGYAAQEDDGCLIESIKGSLSNVMGLPMERLLPELARIGVRTTPAECV